MIENWKNALDKGKKVDTIFMELYRAFDTLNHNFYLPRSMAFLSMR